MSALARTPGAQSGLTAHTGFAAQAGGTHGAARWMDAAVALHGWMRERDYCGHDPHDALSSPLLARLTFGNRWLGVAWTQLGKRTPPHYRALLGVRPQRNAKGIGLALAACARLGGVDADRSWRLEAAALTGWLAEHAVRDGDGAGWGYPFPWANRDFFAPAGTPSGVASAFIGHALLDASERWGDDDAATLAAEAALFVQQRLRRVPLGDGFAFSYTPLDTRVVHNASVLAASLLARVGARIGDAQMRADARTAARASAALQHADGSWAYGVGRRNAWIDSFHTSYLLVALEQVRTHAGAEELAGPIARGTAFWRRSFFTGPAVGYLPDRPYPIDQHAVAHTIIALRALAPLLPDARAHAERLGAWSLDEMRGDDGAFHYRRPRAEQVDDARYMRWTQAWMLLALAELAAWSHE